MFMSFWFAWKSMLADGDKPKIGTDGKKLKRPLAESL
jgi:hypothetical protein